MSQNTEAHYAQETLAHNSAIELSELTLLSSALGSGIKHPTGFLPTPFWTSTSAIHPAVHQAFIRAEHKFAAQEMAIVREERRQLKELEKQLKALEGKTKANRVTDTISAAIPGMAGPVTDYEEPEVSADRLREQIEALKAKIASHSDVTWRESGVTKSTLIEVLANSRYHATSFIDSLGTELGLYFACPVRFAANLSWLSLSDAHTSDVSLIRSSSTGGASIHKLARLDHDVKFNWLISAHKKSIRTLAELITTRTSARAAIGHTLLVDEEHDDKPKFGELQHEDTWFRIFNEFYKSPESPYQVGFSNGMQEMAWKKFTDAKVYDLIHKADLDWYDHDETTLVCKPSALTSAVMQAAVNRVVLRHINTGDMPVDRVIRLTPDDLSWAWDTAKNVFHVILGFDKDFARARRARQLSYSRFQITPERLDSAYHSVFSAMSKVGGILSHSAAVRLPDVSAKLLDAMVSRGKLRMLLREIPADNVELREANTAGRVPARAYMLPSVMAMNPEEAKAELEVAIQSPEHVSDEDTILRFVELRDMAELGKRQEGRLLPAVPINEMSSNQILAIPAILAMYPDEVHLRGTDECPEHPSFTEVLDGKSRLPADLPSLWFRWDRIGQPLMPWQHMKYVRWSGAPDATKPRQDTSEPTKPHLELLGIA